MDCWTEPHLHIDVTPFLRVHMRSRPCGERRTRMTPTNSFITPDPEHFLIREQDGLRLITPKSSAAFDDQIWNPNNLQFRSRVETLDGETVSQGFKKFMNLGQGPERH